MVAQDEPAPTMTVEEYLVLEEAAEVKHEYVHGYVYAMAGGTIDHDRIAHNVRAAIDSHLGDGPCTVLGPDVRVRVSPSVYYYPDILVTCDEMISGDAMEAPSPRLVVEILSRPTEATDRGGKFGDYQTLVSLEEYVLVDSRRQVVECFRRTGPALWLYQRYRHGQSVTLDTIGLTLPVAALYRRTRL